MRTQWHPIDDPELGTSTIIAPRSGHLLVSAAGDQAHVGQPLSQLLQLVLGTHASARGNSRLRRAAILDVADTAVAAGAPALEVRMIRRSAALCLRWLPLRCAVAMMRVLWRPGRPGKIALSAALESTAAAFGRRSRQDCLPVSLCRHVYLRRLGIASSIILGAQVPTEKMHAWVQVGEHPVLECPDVLVHYQSCVAYF